MMKNVFVSLLVLAPAVSFAGNFPSNGKVGECYAKVTVPAQEKIITKRQMVRPASFRLVTIPAEYKTVTRTVVVQEASEKVEVLPAEYKTVEEVVKVEDEKRRVIPVEAKYRMVKRRALIKPARKVWKKGKKTKIQRRDPKTGEILCLVEEPAVYGTVYRRELVSPATTRVEIIPAKYKTVKKRVLVSPARARVHDIPALTRVVKSKVLLKPEIEKREPIPAQYRNVKMRVTTRQARKEWRAIVCKKSQSYRLIGNLQQALAREGLYNGSIDGIYGQQTKVALYSYQKRKGIGYGYLTKESLQSLGVTKN